MKLAILGTRGIPARYGGFETFAEQLAVRLAANGVDVTVFCPTPIPKANQTYRKVTLRYVMYPSAGTFSEVLWDARCFWVARRGFDVVYMLGVGGSFAAWIPRVCGTGVWINSDGIEWKRAKWNLCQRAYLALAEALSVLFASRMIADAKSIAQYLRRRYPLLSQISTIAYGADLPSVRPSADKLEKYDLKPSAYYIVVCRLEPENHVLEILEGFEGANSTLPLIVLGNIEDPNEYVRKLLDRRSSRIRFIGTVFDKDMLNALRFFARAYMHGHSAGGTNPSLLEAMACSNLIIAHYNPFNREVLADAGLYFKAPDELSQYIRAIDGGTIEVECLRMRASSRIKEQYQWDQIAKSYFDLLDPADSRSSGMSIGQRDRPEVA